MQPGAGVPRVRRWMASHQRGRSDGSRGTAYHGITEATKLPPTTRIWFRPDVVKKGASAVRYAAYRQAGTIGEF